MDIWTFLVIGFVILWDSDAKSEDDCSVNVKFRRCYSCMFPCVSCFCISLGSVPYEGRTLSPSVLELGSVWHEQLKGRQKSSTGHLCLAVLLV